MDCFCLVVSRGVILWGQVNSMRESQRTAHIVYITGPIFISATPCLKPRSANNSKDATMMFLSKISQSRKLSQKGFPTEYVKNIKVGNFGDMK